MMDFDMSVFYFDPIISTESLMEIPSNIEYS